MDAVIVNHGMKTDFGPIRDWGFDMGEWKENVSPKMETNIPGIHNDRFKEKNKELETLERV